MTPAIAAARAGRVSYRLHEYEHDPAVGAYGMEAAERLGVNPDRVFKTLVVSLDARSLAVGLVPVSGMLGMKLMARAAGARKAAMAEAAEVERATGYVLGGVSPLGQKKRLRTFIDRSAQGFSTIYVSAGRRGLELEMAAQDLVRLTGGVFAALVQPSQVL